MSAQIDDSKPFKVAWTADLALRALGVKSDAPARVKARAARAAIRQGSLSAEALAALRKKYPVR